MADNTHTTINDEGIVNPRIYQVYKSLIRSKEAMEPLSVIHGTGPVCGFNKATLDPKFPGKLFIGSLYNINKPSDPDTDFLESTDKHVILTNDDDYGQVQNAFIGNDSILVLAPDTISVDIPQFSVNNRSYKLLALLGSHEYEENPDPKPITSANFSVIDISEKVKYLTLTEILTSNYHNVFDWVHDGIKFGTNRTFDYRRDCILGLYLFGWNEDFWGSNREDVDYSRYYNTLESLGFILPLIPYGGKYPVEPFGLNPMVMPYLKDQFTKIFNSIANLETHDDNQRTDISQINTMIQGLHGKIIELEVSENASEKLQVNKFVLNGIDYLKGVTDKKISWWSGSQWSETENNICLGIVSKTRLTLQDKDIPATTLFPDWELAIIEATNYLNRRTWDGSVTWNNKSTYPYLIAVFWPDYSNPSGNMLPREAFGNPYQEQARIPGIMQTILGIGRYDLRKSQISSSGTTQLTGSDSNNYCRVKYTVSDTQISISLRIKTFTRRSTTGSESIYNLSDVPNLTPYIRRIINTHYPDISDLPSGIISDTISFVDTDNLWATDLPKAYLYISGQSIFLKAISGNATGTNDIEGFAVKTLHYMLRSERSLVQYIENPLCDLTY